MRGRLRFGSVPVAVLLAGAVHPGAGLSAQALSYPAAPRGPVVEEMHGTPVPDPYRWLEETDSRRTAAWVGEETALTGRFLAGLTGRDAIRRRLTSLSSFSRTEVPFREAGRIFFVENSGAQPQGALYAQEGFEGSPRTILDPNRISPDGSVAIRDFSVSPDGRHVAYVAARGGRGEGEIRVREVRTGRDRREVVHGALTSACWTRDGAGFLYVGRPSVSRPEDANDVRLEKQVRYHVLGTLPSQDRLLRAWKDATWVYCMASDDGRYALAAAEKDTESEIVVADLGDPARPNLGAPWTRVLPGAAAFHTPVDFVGRTLYVRTNLEAPRKRVVALDLADPGGPPRTVVPESEDVIVDAVIAGDRLVVHYLADVRSRLRLFTLEGRPAGEVALPGIGAVEWPLGARVSEPEFFYAFTSFLEPSTVYRCDPRSGTSVPFRRPRVPFDASPYETRQVFVTSRDGARVPMFVTGARNLERDGRHPALLTAYGGYGATTPPAFEPDIPLFLEMGGVWAVANIRGGGEYGEDWHRGGMLDRKQNSFDDFFAAAERLISEGYTSADRLAVYGHSNGGLLIGAAITQRPELFAAAVANAGHYDMLRYHRFTIGAGWIAEYGSPDDPLAFRYLLAYSPLHNVKAGHCYPATLLLAADHDDSVVPSHAYKFAAALQAAQSCDAPILLRVARDASHNYSSRGEWIAERSDMWSFLGARLGVHRR